MSFMAILYLPPLRKRKINFSIFVIACRLLQQYHLYTSILLDLFKGLRYPKLNSILSLSASYLPDSAFTYTES